MGPCENTEPATHSTYELKQGARSQMKDSSIAGLVKPMGLWMSAEAALAFSIQYESSTGKGYLVFPDRLRLVFAFAIAGTWSRAMLCWHG